MLGFDSGVDVTATPNALEYVRISGGLSEHLRFFLLTDPAITRKRTIEGQMVKTFAKLKVRRYRAAGPGDAAVRHHHRTPATSSPTAS